MNLFKALIPGSILTWLGASVLGRNGSTSGFLDIYSFTLQGHEVHWSWPLFLSATALAWVVFWALD